MLPKSIISSRGVIGRRTNSNTMVKDCKFCCLLHNLKKLSCHGMIAVYLLHGNGGYDACYGRVLNSRGGSNETAGIGGYYFERDQTQEAGCSQDRGYVSHHPCCIANVPRYLQDRQAREQLDIPIDLLTSLSVTGKTKQLLTVSQAMSKSFVRSCYRCILCHKAFLSAIGSQSRQSDRNTASGVHLKGSAMVILCSPVSPDTRKVGC